MTEQPPNIVLTGFVGTGKTEVGRLVAASLGRVFFDADLAVEQRLGKPAAQVYAEQGERPVHDAERAVAADLGRPRGLVAAAGGSLAVDADRRALLERGSMLVCLQASPEAIVERIAPHERTSLPADPSRRRHCGFQLMEARAGAYAGVPLQFDTTTLAPPEAARALVALLERHARLPAHTVLPVNAGTTGYPVYIGRGLLDHLGHLLATRAFAPGRCAVVTTPNLDALYGGRTLRSLRAAGFDPLVLLVPDGENHKRLATVQTLYERFADKGVHRTTPVVALGGGVVGDMAGFAAATWMRGTPFVQVPSTLLSMVDSSVGGKTAVDLDQGKNLVGAFKFPELVVVDPDLLATLPSEEIASGAAEVVKHAVLGDPALFERLEGSGPVDWDEVLPRAVAVKVRFVENDPTERGPRMLLNLGHTFGHAFEQVSDFSLRHGEAVGLGMLCAARLARLLGHAESGLEDRTRRALSHLGLPVTRRGDDPEALIAAMRLDKKRTEGGLRFVVPLELAVARIVHVADMTLVRRALRAVDPRTD